MERVIIARGHGYQTVNPPYVTERCTAFDGYEIIANPLGEFSAADRERRVLGRVDGKPGTGTDYGSHAIKLAVRENGGTYKGSRNLFILMQHGGGRVVYAMKQMFDGGATERALLALPEAELYGILYTMAEMAEDAHRQGCRETVHRWAKAFVDKRIRKRRNGTVEIESDWEAEARKRRRTA
jgi:hypothetical protein